MENENNATPAPESVVPETASNETDLTSSEVEPSVEAAPAEVKQALARIKKIKLKVDGEEFDEELPFEVDDNPEIIKYLQQQLQLGKMGQKRAKEKATLESQVDQLIQKLKTNPREILEDPGLGLNFEKVVEDYINEKIENSKKSPEQIEKEKLLAELAEERKLRAEEKKKLEDEKREALQQKAYEQYENDMNEAFIANPGLPKSPFTVNKIAEYMMAALEEGLDVTIKDIVPYVAQSYREEMKQLAGSLSEDDIEAFLGADKIASVHKKKLAASRKASTSTPPPVIKTEDTGRSPFKKTSDQPKKTMRQIFKI